MSSIWTSGPDFRGPPVRLVVERPRLITSTPTYDESGPAIERGIGKIRRPRLPKSWLPAKRCLNPGHNPPGHMVIPDEGYEHICPGCGRTTLLQKPVVTW